MELLTTQLNLLRPGDSFFSLRRVRAQALREVIQARQMGALRTFSYHETQYASHTAIASCPYAKYALIEDFYQRSFSTIEKIQEVGITGTNGKTSVATLLQSALQSARVPWATLGTLGLILPQRRQKISFNLTTPDIIDKYWSKAYLSTLGIQGLISEVSSHGLDQQRNLGSSYHAVMATSVSLDDHRDYHKTQIHYLKSKARLFNEYASQLKICHFDNKLLPFIQSDTNLRVIPKTPVRQARSIEEAFHRPHLDLVSAYMYFCGIGQVLTESQIIEKSSLPGRFDSVKWPKSRGVFIDYAHTPEAMDYVISLLAEYYHGKELWVLFGCGGDRDRQKRHQMFNVAKKHAAKIIITEDNNRSEKFESILRDILSNSSENGDSVQVIEKREQAIKYIYDKSPCESIILLAGKGHETYVQRRFNNKNNTDLKQVMNYAVF